MSIKSVLAMILFFVGSIMLAYMIQIQTNGNPFDQSVTKRAPGSVGSMHLRSLKDQNLKMEVNDSHIHTEKMHGPMSLTLESLNPGVEGSGQVFRLRLTVETHAPVDTVDYKWSVPEGIEVIYGALNGQLYNLEPDQPQFIEVDFRANSSTNLQIHAHISSQQGDMRFAEVAQFNTAFEAAPKADKAEALEKSSAEETKSLLKVFQ